MLAAVPNYTTEIKLHLQQSPVNMTYARARLLLGISGVGSIVVLAMIIWIAGWPHYLLENEARFGLKSLSQLSIVTGILILWLLPFDLLGGYLLPRKFGKSQLRFVEWFPDYVRATVFQAVVFVLFGSVILCSAQLYGRWACLLVVTLLMAACFVIRNLTLVRRKVGLQDSSQSLLDAIGLIQSWEIFVPSTIVVAHKDQGFTGGVIGFGHQAKIVIPKAWLDFDRDQLAATIARRAEAIRSGSYTRGLMLAFAWNLLGFGLSSLLPNAGLSTVAELVTTMCGFTIWSFIGLLTLPTLSRNASLRIDQALIKQGVPRDLIANSAKAMDQLQDDEPERSKLVETIFHPVPSVSNRSPSGEIRGGKAWNVARTTLFLSWGCLGLLARSVHCNVGRPELWTTLPTD